MNEHAGRPAQGGEKVFDTRKAEGQRVDAGAVPAASTKNAGSTPARSPRFGNDGSTVRFRVIVPVIIAAG